MSTEQTIRLTKAAAKATTDETSIFLTVSETMARLNVGLTTVYKLISHGSIKAVKQGRSTLIERSSVDAYAASLPAFVPRRSNRPRQAA